MTMVMIGVDPHKGSHTAAAVDRDENELDWLRVRSSTKQCDRGINQGISDAITIPFTVVQAAHV